MFLLQPPSPDRVRRFLASQEGKTFSYLDVGATRMDSGIAGYTRDHRRRQIGTGERHYTLAIAAVRRWEMFNLGWVYLMYPTASIDPGTTVGMLASHLGCWSLSPCRVVYGIEETTGPVHRFGFAYGTLPEHVERGEERFSVEWQQADDSVWYDLLAYSQPRHPLARLGYPFSRRLQKRFALDSMAAMRRAVSGPL